MWCLVLVPAEAQPNLDLIRVAVSREDPHVTLQVHGRFRMFALHTQDPIHEGRRLDAVAVTATPQGLLIGEQAVPYLGVRIEPESRAAISLNGKRLRGTLEIVRQQNLTLLVINHVSLEDYLRGVLSKEAPDYWPPEALKAIAIAARTYAVYQRLTKEAVDYDVTGDVMSQDYGGKTAEKAATTRAVKATAGLLLLAHGKLFPPFYHSTCGGTTENGRVMGPYDLPPLRGGVVCHLCERSPFYLWQRRLTRADINWALLKSRHGSVGPILDLQVTKRTASGRAENITITGALRAVRLSGYEFRALFGFDRIRSPLITIIAQDDAFLIEGRGWGHGVGMCQWGAAEMARRGFSAAEILAYYYPGGEVAPAQELLNRPMDIIGGST
ncbi:MAG: SpoIID/LytB domain-containing protein [Candidatus Omnitrophica bacterium]|nr:SpoIID/LytB domain-containing protein [Candidatus Omnitrophota bacterium]